jgi:hypothetical protein
MLAQYGQVMQLRQMQQENESQNALRNFYANGGDISNPEQRLQLMSKAPLLGQKIVGQQSEIAARDVGTTEKTIKLFKNESGRVSSPEDAARLITAVYSNPLTKSYVEAIAPLDKALAAIPSDPAKLEQWKRGFGLEADKLYVDANTIANNETSRANNAATVGATYAGQQSVANTAANRLEFDKQKRSVIPMEGQYGSVGYRGDINPVTGYGLPQAPALPPAAANNLVSNQQPVANVNALREQPVNQPGAPTVANAAVIQQQQNVPRPAPRAGYKYNEQGQQVKVDEEKLTEAQGKATGFALRAAEAHKVLNDVGKAGEVQPGLIKRIGESVPLVGEGLGTALNATQTSQQQQVEQAQRAFVNAILRQESGAAINESEFNNAKKQYFPQPGDKPAVIEQKRQNRETAIKSLEIAGGPGIKQANKPTSGIIDFGSLK